jgi:hypothetical protein
MRQARHKGRACAENRGRTDLKMDAPRITEYAEAQTLRHADLATIASLLRGQRVRALDVVAPARSLLAVAGQLRVDGTVPRLDEDGVTATAGQYGLTPSAHGQLADMLDIPIKYARRMHAQHVGLWDVNVNGWLHGAERDEAALDRRFLLRILKADEHQDGLIRAVLSDRYRIIDNLDVLLAALDGIHEAGTPVEVTGCDLTEQRMYVRISAPGVAAMAPGLMAGYRSPFTGLRGEDLPMVFAGFELSNSETGHGAQTITPRLTFQVCSNGAVISKDAAKAVHLGSKLDEGVIRWSEDTKRKQLELIRSQAKDAVATFLSTEYVEAKIRELEKAAHVEVTKPAETIALVAKRLAFTEAQAETILGAFIKGGQMTAGGIMQAITATAQTAEDGNDAAELERQAVEAMALVPVANRTFAAAATA